MTARTRSEIDDLLDRLSEADQRLVVEFLSRLLDERTERPEDLVLASEELLAREWSTPEEDAAWAHL